MRVQVVKGKNGQVIAEGVEMREILDEYFDEL